MLIVLSLYFLVVWLVFSKFKLLPWNRAWKTIVYGIALAVALIVVGALQHYTPSSQIGVVQASTQHIYPLVSGRVVAVHVRKTQAVAEGDLLFEIDSEPYQYQVDKLTAITKLAQMKLEDTRTLVSKKAASRREIDKYQAELDQARALLADAQYQLRHTQSRVPSDGIIVGTTLEEGQYVSPAHGVLNFINRDGHWILTGVKQNGLVRIAAGQPVNVVFSSSPGQVYSSTVAQVPTDIVGGQVFAEDIDNPFAALSGGGGLYPVRVNFPVDADPTLKRAGTAASVTFFTDEGNPINTLANILQWISSWMTYIF